MKIPMIMQLVCSEIGGMDCFHVPFRVTISEVDSILSHSYIYDISPPVNLL